MILGDQANFLLTANIIITDFWHLLHVIQHIIVIKIFKQPRN